MTDPIAGLDDVPWKSLTHAYGPAEDTPHLLRRLAEGDADEETWGELFASLTHQGTVYAASAAAAPFLIALTQVATGEDLHALLDMLEPIAAGASDEEPVAERCKRAAEAGLARYVELLAHGNPTVRSLAAKLVARFPQRAKEWRAPLEGAIDRERDAAARVELITSYDAIVERDDLVAHERLRALARDEDGSVAARASLSLVKIAAADEGSGRPYRGGGYAPSRAWLDAIVHELAAPARKYAIFPVRDVLRATPATARAALFEAILSGADRSNHRVHAFDLGRAMLWLAFGAAIGGAARKPNPFVFVQSLDFRMPWDTGGGSPETMERLPKVLHWRKPNEREPLAEWTCTPYVHTWDFPRPDYWKEPPTSGALLGVEIVPPCRAEHFTTDQRRVVERLATWDDYWRTDSDLPMVYGLPALRRELAALVGIKRGTKKPWWRP